MLPLGILFGQKTYAFYFEWRVAIEFSAISILIIIIYYFVNKCYLHINQLFIILYNLNNLSYLYILEKVLFYSSYRSIIYYLERQYQGPPQKILALQALAKLIKASLCAGELD